jgi:hypothetical protein
VQPRGVAPGVAAQQPGGAGAEQAQQDADGGDLPHAVGAQEAVHLTGVDGKLQALQRARAAEPLAQAGHQDDIIRPLRAHPITLLQTLQAGELQCLAVSHRWSAGRLENSSAGQWDVVAVDR